MRQMSTLIMMPMAENRTRFRSSGVYCSLNPTRCERRTVWTTRSDKSTTAMTEAMVTIGLATFDAVQIAAELLVLPFEQLHALCPRVCPS